MADPILVIDLDAPFAGYDSVDEWYVGEHVDHISATCPVLTRSGKSPRRGQGRLYPEAGDVCGLCVRRWRAGKAKRQTNKQPRRHAHQQRRHKPRESSMDELDAAQQWLQGYMAGKDGKAQEEYLLKEGAKVGHSAAALRRAKVSLGMDSEELSRGTKWSRWWWLPSATYSAADAKAVGITRDNWPYGPNIDLKSRIRLVAWAKHRGLKVARRTAPLCLKWLEKGTCRGCGTRSGHDEFRIDHMSGWTLDGTPAVIVNHPYHLRDDDIKRLAAVSENPALSVSSPGAGWYGASTVQVDVWNSAVQDAMWKQQLATKREASAVPEEETTDGPR